MNKVDNNENYANQNKGKIFAITGPSGAGKTTYTQLVSEYYADTARRSVGYATRQKRPGEKEGEQYYFISNKEFEDLIQNDAFACYTNFCGNKCGITKEYVKKVIEEEKKDLIFDTVMDISDIRRMGTNVTIIFLEASLDELKNRILNRDPNINLVELDLRMEKARKQMEIAKECDYIIRTDSNRTKQEVLKDITDIIEEVRENM